MEVKLCPYCMQTTFGDFCKNCKRKVDYQEKPMQLPVGTELQGYHHYLVGAALGQGGFGVTYLALDTDSNRRVALKEFYPVHCSGRTKDTTVMAFDGQDEDFEKGKQRFLLEAQTMQRLSRVQSVVEVYDCFQANNTVYLVMEYVEGQSLKKYLEENGPIAPKKFFPMVKPLLEDIAAMHRQGVIHRDIAPDNIILDKNGHLRLIDFGTAREYMGQASMTVVVKKGFAPVEQYTRRGQSAATDVYALAATMYYCITGHVVPDSMDRIEEDTLKKPSEWGVKVTAEQDRALVHALGVRVKDRTQTVDAFLKELLPEPPKPKPVPKPEPKPIPKEEPKAVPKQEPIPIAEGDSAKKKKPIWIGIAAVLLAVVGIVVAVSGGKKAPEASPDVPGTVPVRNLAEYDYAYSDDPEDNSCYNAEEFATIVNSEDVRDLLPLGTKIKMVPNSKEITDEAIEFELVAYKHFRLANGEDFAKTTWLAVNLLNEARSMNMERTNKGGWEKSDLRCWLNETLYPTLPAYWRGLMEPVQVRSTKDYWLSGMRKWGSADEFSNTVGYSPNNTVIINDFLFIPSHQEVWPAGLAEDGHPQEIDPDAEEQVFSCFVDNGSRLKNRCGSSASWWLRSTPAESSVYFDRISAEGFDAVSVAANNYGVCLGFCLGGGGDAAEVQNAASYDYAYSDDPADNAQYTAEEFAEIVKSENVRDLLPLGTKIKMVPNSKEITDEAIEFELVAYKHFRLANGEDFAKTTWLAVNLLNETRKMNSDSTNKGGWSESELRQWLNETLYPSLPDYWKGLMEEVEVRSTAGEGATETVSSNDRLFIPSLGEMNAYFADVAGYKAEIDGTAEEQTFSIFTDDASRVKARMGNGGWWWLRSPWAGSSSGFANVTSNGNSGSNLAGNSNGVCPGFCI